MASSEELHEQSPPRVKLMASCLCDAFFDDVAIATVEVLEHLGCHVEFPEDQTCCGQPAFNSGDWEAARPVARHTLRVFQGPSSVVVPSGSCARMLSHGALLLFEGESDSAGVRELGQRSFELADFIVRKLGIARWPGRLDARLAFHRSCHSRGTTYAESALALLRSIQGLTLLELGEAEQCCGFGGTFSVAFPNVSAGMGGIKLSHIAAVQSDGLISADMGCLLHLSGIAAKQGQPLVTRHISQVLRDALRSSTEASS
jgi:L-lactate dehydrogenase complex protein LldE